MVWNANWERVKKAMDCGCDDVLSRPYSLKQLEERVGFLVTQRKGFVVASDYIGPDRRKDISRGDGAPLLQVVNTLKLRTVDGLPPEAVAAVINEGLKTSRDALVRSRMTRGAFQIGVLAGFLRDAADQVTAPVTHANDLKRIAKIADEVGKLAAQYDETAAIGTCDTVIGIARMAAAGTDFAKKLETSHGVVSCSSGNTSTGSRAQRTRIRAQFDTVDDQEPRPEILNREARAPLPAPAKPSRHRRSHARPHRVFGALCFGPGPDPWKLSSSSFTCYRRGAGRGGSSSESEGGALGMGGGGQGGGIFSARGAANALTRTTAFLAAGFFATSILLGILASRSGGTVVDAPVARRRLSRLPRAARWRD